MLFLAHPMGGQETRVRSNDQTRRPCCRQCTRNCWAQDARLTWIRSQGWKNMHHGRTLMYTFLFSSSLAMHLHKSCSVQLVHPVLLIFSGRLCRSYDCSYVHFLSLWDKRYALKKNEKNQANWSEAAIAPNRAMTLKSHLFSALFTLLAILTHNCNNFM